MAEKKGAMTVAEAGRRGGQTTSSKYGSIRPTRAASRMPMPPGTTKTAKPATTAKATLALQRGNSSNRWTLGTLSPRSVAQKLNPMMAQPIPMATQPTSRVR